MLNGDIALYLSPLFEPSSDKYQNDYFSQNTAECILLKLLSLRVRTFLVFRRRGHKSWEPMAHLEAGYGFFGYQSTGTAT